MSIRQKRILFARPADADNFNAQAKNAQNILRYWHSTDYRPTVFSFFAPAKDVASNSDVDVLRIKPDHLWRAKVFASYMRPFDAVFYPGVHHFADWAALKARNFLRRPVPVIMTIEGLVGVAGDVRFDEKYSEIAGHQAFCQKISHAHWRRVNDLYLMATHIIAISPYLARQAIALYGAKVSTLTLGVDLGLFRRTEWARRVRPRVVCAGHVRAHKRPDVFLKLATQFPNADFVWFGEGEMRSALCKKATTDGISNLSFPGAQTQDVLAQEFSSSDIMVLPSRNEGVPKVTQEAAAAGLAQIVFGHYEAPSVVDGINGFVVWSDAELGQKLAILLDDSELMERFGRAGVGMAEAWSWEVVAPRWQQRICQVVDHAMSAWDESGKRTRALIP